LSPFPQGYKVYGVEKVANENEAPGGAPKALLLTPRDAARALAISERTLWGLTKQGLIPCIRIGRAVRYALADLEAWIESHRQKGDG
jgi:excisionase family DNA binding protein